MLDADYDSASALVAYTPVQNVDELTLARNRKKNRQNFPMLESGWKGIDDVVLIGGGPSINKHLPDIITFNKIQSLPIVTVNGSLTWGMKHNLWPTIQIVVDARESNKRFTHPVVPGTFYIICDTVHPTIVEGLPKPKTYLWDRKAINGGSTVMLCAIPLLRAMGVKKIHIFGFDSCVTDRHHAYQQPENDSEPLVEIEINGKVFRCTRWMLDQAEQFLELRNTWGNYIVYGDGLIAHLQNNLTDHTG